MSYRIIVGRSAEKDFRRKIPSNQANRIREAIDDLADSPRPYPQSKELKGRDERRLRVGSYRVLYTVDEERQEVYVVEVFHRQRDYR